MSEDLQPQETSDHNRIISVNLIAAPVPHRKDNDHHYDNQGKNHGQGA